ncbi:MAG: DegV family EDD domain-containing protein [Actinobacteria bacterium]|nr:DegV family EDD domain-containing protein [Actinomycetota bacterium]
MALRSIGIVTDEASEIPDNWASENDIEVVKATIEWPGIEMDKISGENIFQKMLEADKQGKNVFIKTGLSNIGGFKQAFERQLKKFDKVLYISVSSKFSGALNGAIQATKFFSDAERKRIFTFDTLSGSCGQGLFVIRAKELIEKDLSLDSILGKLKQMIPIVKIVAFFKDPKWVVASGRVSQKAGEWLKRMKKLGFHPAMTIKDGKAVSGGIVRARNEIEAIVKLIKKFERKAQGKLRAFIAHGGVEENARELEVRLKNMGVEVSMTTMASLVVAGHTGPGTLLCAWHEVI